MKLYVAKKVLHFIICNVHLGRKGVSCNICGYAEKFAIQQLENLQPNIKSIIQLNGSPSHWRHFCRGYLDENFPQISWRAEHTLATVVTR